MDDFPAGFVWLMTEVCPSYSGIQSRLSSTASCSCRLLFFVNVGANHYVMFLASGTSQQVSGN
jgi:hypothetical protein